MPLHDLTGGNAWISYILASLDPERTGPDPMNVALLDQGPSVLTLDLSAGQTPKVNGAALRPGSDRAKQQLLLAATLMDADTPPITRTVTYDPATGALSFRVQNNTGHKLISGFPEGRRMFVNIQAYDASNALIYEVNPYDFTVGTLKGLPGTTLGPNEAYVDDPCLRGPPEQQPDRRAARPSTSCSPTAGPRTTAFRRRASTVPRRAVESRSGRASVPTTSRRRVCRRL